MREGRPSPNPNQRPLERSCGFRRAAGRAGRPAEDSEPDLESELDVHSDSYANELAV